jgi:predicted transposase/invertase (TIGR01784 family)
LVHDFEPRDIAKGEGVEGVYGKKHRLIFVFTNSVKKQKTPENYFEWMQAIDDSLDEEVNEKDYTNPHIGRLFELIETDQITPEERARMKDEYSQAELEKKGFEEGKEIGFDDGYGEGKEDGIEEGIEQGIEKGKIETARNFKALGISEEQIASATGLSLDEVRAL